MRQNVKSAAVAVLFLRPRAKEIVMKSRRPAMQKPCNICIIIRRDSFFLKGSSASRAVFFMMEVSAFSCVKDCTVNMLFVVSTMRPVRRAFLCATVRPRALIFLKKNRLIPKNKAHVMIMAQAEGGCTNIVVMKESVRSVAPRMKKATGT